MSSTGAETRRPEKTRTAAQKRPRPPWMEAMHADWRRRWPAAFTTPVPLAVGFSGRMRAILREEGVAIDRKQFGIAISTWTGQGAYLHALMRGDMRRNLDGSDAGWPDEAAKLEAKQILDKRAARRQAQKKQPSKSVPLAPPSDKTS